MPTHPAKQTIKIATDAAIFTVQDGQLHILLIKMKKKSFVGRWALPGGLLKQNELTTDAAGRILASSTGIKDCFLEQLATFDAVKRDPLGRVISVAYFALLPLQGVKLHTAPQYADIRWWPVESLPDLAYDHKVISQVALDRLRAKLGYTNIAWSVLPREFTLAELQEVYEAMLGRVLDKRNFRKKLLTSGLLVETGRARTGAHRPAALYRFSSRKPKVVELF